MSLDLLGVLQNASPLGDSSSGLTVRELMAKTGWGNRKVRERLQTLAIQNRLIVEWREIIGVSGQRVAVPTYRLKDDV